MLRISKKVQKLIDHHLAVNPKAVDGYILRQTKYTGPSSLDTKYGDLAAWVQRNGGVITASGPKYISGEYRCIKIIIRLPGEAKTALTLVR